VPAIQPAAGAAVVGCCGWLQVADARPAESLLNINGLVDQAYESASLNELLAAPPSALQGLAPWWVQRLQQRKQCFMLLLPAQHAASHACVTDAASAGSPGRALVCLLMHAWLCLYFVLQVNLRVIGTVLQCYLLRKYRDDECCSCAACRTDGALQQLKIKSVNDLAKWKYAGWADALVTLAEYEREDMSSR
jgi:hypothetical protein